MMFFRRWWRGDTAVIRTQLTRLEGKVDSLVSSEQDLQNDLDAIKSSVGAVAAQLTSQAQQLADLKAQLATGSPVTQEQLDALHAEASGIAASLSAIATPAPATT